MSGEIKHLGTKEASRLLGVSESTVKRWVDHGDLQATRTLGRHRKIRLDDLLQFAQVRNLVPPARPAPSVQPLEPRDVQVLADRLFSAIATGDQELAMRTVCEGHERGLSVARIGDELISPAMVRVGHAWSTEQMDVYEEHRGTQACLFAVLALKLRLARPDDAGRPLAVGGGAEGDHYLLANLLVELVLMEEGWNVENVGPNTPMPSLCRAIRERKPRLVWVSCSYLPDPERFVAGFQQLREEARTHGASVAVGGRALTEDVRARMNYSHFGDRLINLADYARDLRPS